MGGARQSRRHHSHSMPIRRYAAVCPPRTGVKTDAMYVSTFTADGQSGQWSAGELPPYGPLQLEPAATVLNYGQVTSAQTQAIFPALALPALLGRCGSTPGCSFSALHTTLCTLHTANYNTHSTLHATHYTLHTTRHTPHATLLTTHYPLHTAHCTLHTAHYSPLITHHPLLTTHYSHLTTPYYTLPTTHCPPLTTHCLLLTPFYRLIPTD